MSATLKRSQALPWHKEGSMNLIHITNTASAVKFPTPKKRTSKTRKARGGKAK